MENIIGDTRVGVRTRNQLSSNLSELIESGQPNDWRFTCCISQIEPKSVKDALLGPSWVEAMQEELLQFKKLGVWHLVDLPRGAKKIGTRWVRRKLVRDGFLNVNVMTVGL